jgi:hypothetical protein
LKESGEQLADYFDPDTTLTYGAAKDLTAMFQEDAGSEGRDMASSLATEAQLKVLRDSGFTLERRAKISSKELEALLNLEGQPPRQEDLRVFEKHGVSFNRGMPLRPMGWPF